ncbi:MAG: M56 family metallopeptidase [Bacteroidales bacterium]|jgi:TonB family protein|nr:M56 family metallopeptidase [Bacteroidales bacterium]
MNQVIIYMLKAGMSLAVLYLVYQLFLSRDTMYSRNRTFILASFVLSLILPLISIQTRQPHDIQFFGAELSAVNVGEDPGRVQNDSVWSMLLQWQNLLLIIYFAGMLLAGLKLLTELAGLAILIIRKGKNGEKIVFLNNSKTSGFSAFGHIFIDKSLDPHDAGEIIRHEQKHLDRMHFFDILLAESLKVIQWFNPFIYMFDKSLRAVHEYQADEECLSSGIPVHSYQGLVMNQVFRARIFNPSNSFSNPTLIKKRMIMMTKKRSKALANLKILLVLPGLAALLIVFSTCSEKMSFTDSTITEVAAPSNAPVSKAGEMEPFVVVEEMPMFPGGDSALLAYIATNTTYPPAAKQNNIQGKVIIRFAIKPDGYVDRISVLKSVDPELDKEAVRVVSTLPQFKPGKQGGQPVPVWYMVPINFALSGNKQSVLKFENAPPPPPPPPADGANVIKETASDKGAAPAPFMIVEQMPEYPGGDAGMLTYIATNIKYPEYAKTNKITGQVIVRFVVSAAGKVEMISVLKGVHPELDAEAIRVVKTLSDFKPGTQGGKPVPVWMMVPINFTLK